MTNTIIILMQYCLNMENRIIEKYVKPSTAHFITNNLKRIHHLP